MWFWSFFGNIGVPKMKPIVIYDDSQSCIYLSKNLIFQVHTKHIEIHYHLVWKNNNHFFVKLVCCNTKNMVVNILTKGLYVDKDEYFWHSMMWLSVIVCWVGVLDMNFLPSYLNYFYQVIIVWNIYVTCTNFSDYHIC